MSRWYCQECALLLHEHECDQERVTEVLDDRGPVTFTYMRCGSCGEEVEERDDPLPDLKETLVEIARPALKKTA